MENELLEDKFKDIDEKVDFLIELCQALQQENEELLTKVKTLDGQIAAKSLSEENFVRKQVAVQSKIDGLLTKLNTFSETS
ncbi:MAG: cell division protein ZapB [Desulfobacterium sp.]